MSTERTKCLIVKWNPFWNPEEQFEPNTINVHCDILEKFEHRKEEQFVWYGKISKSGKSGVTEEDIKVIKAQISTGMATHLYLYCPDVWPPSYHVARLEDISTSDLRNDPHTPSYYSMIPYRVAYWFKLSDIRKVDRGIFLLLKEQDGKRFDPVSVEKNYPRIVYESIPQVFFDYTVTGGRKWFMKGGIGGMIPRCFKTGGSICANPDVQSESKQQVFVGIPFTPEFENVYEHAIKPALLATGLVSWKADEAFRNIDLMCKVCAGIQESGAAIIDISTWNANVLFELGLIYGLGKEAFIIKQKNAQVPVDLHGMIYVPYDNYNKLKEELIKYLENYKRRSI